MRTTKMIELRCGRGTNFICVLCTAFQCIVMVCACCIKKNCIWSGWTWGQCTAASCGVGSQIGIRTVIQQAQFGGMPCSGPWESFRACDTGWVCTDPGKNPSLYMIIFPLLNAYMYLLQPKNWWSSIVLTGNQNSTAWTTQAFRNAWKEQKMRCIVYMTTPFSIILQSS